MLCPNSPCQRFYHATLGKCFIKSPVFKSSFSRILDFLERYSLIHLFDYLWLFNGYKWKDYLSRHNHLFDSGWSHLGKMPHSNPLQINNEPSASHGCVVVINQQHVRDHVTEEHAIHDGVLVGVIAARAEHHHSWTWRRARLRQNHADSGNFKEFFTFIFSIFNTLCINFNAFNIRSVSIYYV